MKNISIIGGGNLGRSIAEGLSQSNLYKSNQIYITRRKVELIEDLIPKGFNVSSNNSEAIEFADVLIISVKPKRIKELLENYKSEIKKKKPLIISVVTGFSIKDIENIIGEDLSIYRAMPNTAIAIRESMTCISSNIEGKNKLNKVIDLFNLLGKAIEIDEELIDASTILGACGIAYALRFIRAATQGGIEIGFDSQTASLIASQTAKGAASLLLVGGKHPEREIDKVTTPQGCTIAGLNEMEHQGFSSSLIKGIVTSYKKIDNIK